MDKYLQIFMETFGVSEGEAKKLEYQSIPLWDSVGHMSLMAEIEDAFEITLETDDIVDFGSFEKGIEILKKYDVNL